MCVFDLRPILQTVEVVDSEFVIDRLRNSPNATLVRFRRPSRLPLQMTEGLADLLEILVFIDFYRDESETFCRKHFCAR